MDGSPIVASASEQFQRALLAALDKLAKNLREVVEAYFWCGFSLREGAESLDRSVRTFRRWLEEALDHLRYALGDVEADLPWTL
jgi:RNA polymerase sigma factor (sigma-70 family)